MLPVYERVFKFEHKELCGIFFIITRSSHCIKAANILNCNIKTRTEVPQTASLELEVYYESFKNFAKLQSQLFNTVIWTRRKEGNAEGLETNTLHTTHLPCTWRKKIPHAGSLGSSLSSTACHKNPLTSSSLFSTGCLVFHMAFLRIIFKNYSYHLDALPLIASIWRIFPPYCSSNHSVLKNKHLKELFAM